MKYGREMRISELGAVVLQDLCFARQKVLGMEKGNDCAFFSTLFLNSNLKRVKIQKES